MSVELRDNVNNAVREMAAGPSRAVFETIAPLADLEPETLLPELFLQIEEAAKGFDLRKMKPTELVPDVDWASDVTDSVLAQDINSLRKLVGGDYPDLVVALLSVVAAMKSPVNQECYIWTDEDVQLRGE